MENSGKITDTKLISLSIQTLIGQLIVINVHVDSGLTEQQRHENLMTLEQEVETALLNAISRVILQTASTGHASEHHQK